MTVRTRFTLWFAAVLFVSLLTMSILSYQELVAEPRARAASRKSDPGETPESEVIEFLAWCGVFPVSLALVGGWWVIRKALEPVTALTEAARQITEHNLNSRLPRTGNGDELDRLTEVFNAMTERLHQSFMRFREFSLHASHELKTPLTVIHAELETALQAESLDQPQRERLESQMDEIQRLTKIVDGLALLTKADAGQIALHQQPLRLDELVREAYADAQSLARPHDVTVLLLKCEPVSVVGDRHRLRQLLLNLSDNAIKYNQRGGEVFLELLRTSATATLRVSNSGPGIPAHLLPRVFERFFRGDASHSNAVEGCGLGLSIAQWIVQAHGGMIQILSEPGKRTVVDVQLPTGSLEGEFAPEPSASSYAPAAEVRNASNLIT